MPTFLFLHITAYKAIFDIKACFSGLYNNNEVAGYSTKSLVGCSPPQLIDQWGYTLANSRAVNTDGCGMAGIRGTYQGLTATMLKQGTNQAIRFFVMESLKELYRGKDNVNKPVPKLLTGMFGVVAGAASVFGNTPLDVIKTRMQVSHLMFLWFYCL